jgi:hypothetical protein
LVSPTVGAVTPATATLALASSEISRSFELLSPGPVHRGEKLTIVYEWLAPDEVRWFEIYIALADSGGCDEGPLLYSRYVDGSPWNVNYYIGPWLVSAGDAQPLEPPSLPDHFRICIANVDGGKRIQEEFLFEWLP